MNQQPTKTHNIPTYFYAPQPFPKLLEMSWRKSIVLLCVCLGVYVEGHMHIYQKITLIKRTFVYWLMIVIDQQKVACSNARECKIIEV